MSMLQQIYAHIYDGHYEHILERDIHDYLDKSFKHFVQFINQFKLVSKDD